MNELVIPEDANITSICFENTSSFNTLTTYWYTCVPRIAYLSLRNTVVALPERSVDLHGDCNISSAGIEGGANNRSQHVNSFERCLNGRCILMSVALSVIPFLPAANLFFRVGFVIAERVLYIPVAGICCLVAMGIKEIIVQHWAPRVRKTYSNCKNKK